MDMHALSGSTVPVSLLTIAALIIAAFPALVFLSTLLHEFAHAVTGMIFGARVRKITLGRRHTVKCLRLTVFRPDSGRVFLSWKRNRSKVGRAVSIASGLAVNTVLAGICFMLILFSPSPTAVGLAVAFGTANFISVVQTIVSIRRQSKFRSNDLQLLLIFFCGRARSKKLLYQRPKKTHKQRKQDHAADGQQENLRRDPPRRRHDSSSSSIGDKNGTRRHPLPRGIAGLPVARHEHHERDWNNRGGSADPYGPR